MPGRNFPQLVWYEKCCSVGSLNCLENLQQLTNYIPYIPHPVYITFGNHSKKSRLASLRPSGINHFSRKFTWKILCIFWHKCKLFYQQLVGNLNWPASINFTCCIFFKQFTYCILIRNKLFKQNSTDDYIHQRKVTKVTSLLQNKQACLIFVLIN